MEHGFPITSEFINSLAEKADRIYIILGTGSIARDLQTKLRILGLKAPYLVGDRDDQGIRHYKSISEIEDPGSYFFIACYDRDEINLIAPSLASVYKLLGVNNKNHPQVSRLTVDVMISEKTDKWYSDIFSVNTTTKAGLPYVRFGDASGDSNSFKIQIFGGSTSTSSLSYSEHSWPELLYKSLRKVGFYTTVYSWGQWLNSHSDSLLKFLRDGYRQKPDLVIFYTSRTDFNPLYFRTKNTLSTRTGASIHQFIRAIRNDYFKSIVGSITDGINFEEDLITNWVIRHRSMNAMSGLYGFTFWDCISPHSFILPESQSMPLTGRSSSYLARERKRKDDVVAASRDYGVVKDLGEVFTGKGDVYSFFMDEGHLTDKGNEIIAEWFTSAILAEFGNTAKA